MTSIRTNTTVLRRLDELSPEARARLIDDLDSETRELVTLVNELVELANGQHAQEPPELVDLADLAHRVVDRARRRTGREVIVYATGQTVAHGRPTALARAVGNLVDNADKFAPKPGVIEIAVRVGRVTVLDRGPGIPPAEATRVLDRFYRAPTAHGLPGSGLGLAVVRSVAQAHGGDVFVEQRPTAAQPSASPSPTDSEPMVGCFPSEAAGAPSKATSPRRPTLRSPALAAVASTREPAGGCTVTSRDPEGPKYWFLAV